MTAGEIRKRLQKLANKKKAEVLQGFFKTGPGEYGEGDIFFGVTVPKLRKLVKECDGVPLDEVLTLLKSAVHEERLFALLMFVRAYSKGNEAVRKRIYSFY